MHCRLKFCSPGITRSTIIPSSEVNSKFLALGAAIKKILIYSPSYNFARGTLALLKDVGIMKQLWRRINHCLHLLVVTECQATSTKICGK